MLMQLQDDQLQDRQKVFRRSRERTRIIVFLSLLTAMAIVLSYFERFIPLPTTITGMKLGLANIITVMCLYKFSYKETFALVMLRVMLTSLLVGSLMSFFYSMSGAIASFIGMALLLRLGHKYVSPIGVSVFGSLLHILGQLFILSIITGRVTIAVSYAPLLLMTSLFTGIFVGVSSVYFIKHLTRLGRVLQIPFK